MLFFQKLTYAKLLVHLSSYLCLSIDLNLLAEKGLQVFFAALLTQAQQSIFLYTKLLQA
ncbi:hypothetical protein LCGC14_2019010, partial [marine sediment metagenome]